VAARSRPLREAAVFFVVVLLAGTACGDSQTGDSSGPALGPEQYLTLEGEPASLRQFRGRPVVLNFFASWCTPCRLEMPDFERVHQQLDDDVHFVGLNLQEDAGRARDVIDDTGVTYAVGLDRAGAVYRGYNGITMPMTVFLDAKGAAVKTHGGALTAGDLTRILRDEFGVT
jgi:thiol-disulfide isomerase/thioredoxin